MKKAFLIAVLSVVLCAAGGASAESAPTLAAGRDALRRQLDELLSQPPLNAARVSVEVMSLDDGQVLYARKPDELLNPASNTKLVTAATALLRLGPEFRFTTELRTEDKMSKRGRIKNLYLKGGGDPGITTERLHGYASDLFHRGVREVRGDIVIDDTYFDSEIWGPGWEQESSDKSYAAPVAALSLNENAVKVYVFPGEKRGRKGRVEVEPESRYLVLESDVATVRSTGRRRAKVNANDDGDRTRIIVRGRIPAGHKGQVVQRRVYDPARYFGETLRSVLGQHGIKVSGRVRRGPAPQDARTLAIFESDELADIVRDMNKVSSNFAAEMLVKALGAEVKGQPGSWRKGIDVAEELLAELGLQRGTYMLKNGSGLNDTNRFSAHQITTLLSVLWKKFPVMAEFVSSLGIAGRDGTLRFRMEETQAAGRLRAKTGTLEHVTALSGYVASMGGERFAFSILVNDFEGRSSPVVSHVDRLGGALAAAGSRSSTSRDEAMAQLSRGNAAGPAELRARFATYASMAKAADKKNASFLRSALRSEKDPILRLSAADALYQSEPEQGGQALLECMPPSAELFGRMRALSRELGTPLPVISSLLDLAADGSTDAMARLLAIAPLARDADGDGLISMLGDGMVEVGHNAPDELIAALRLASPEQAQAGLEVLGFGLALAAEDVPSFEVTQALKAATGPDAPRAQSWLALIERRVVPGSPALVAPAAPLVVPPLAPLVQNASADTPIAKGDQASGDDEDEDDDTPLTKAPANPPAPAPAAPQPTPAAAPAPAVPPPTVTTTGVVPASVPPAK